MKHYIIPFFLTFQGCPHRCIYCDQKAIAGEPTGEVASVMETFLKYHGSEEYSAEIAFFGGTFSLLPFQRQQELLESVVPYIEKGEVRGIRFSTRPDALDEKRLIWYKERFVTHIELGVQSFQKKFLDLLRRGYAPQTARSAVEMVKKSGIGVGIQLMLGFPGQDREMFFKDIDEIRRLKPDDCRLYPLSVISGTPLEKEYQNGGMNFISLETAVDWVADAVEVIEKEGIGIRRIGLPHSPELEEKIIAGLYHPSFADKVRFELLRRSFDKADIRSGQTLAVHPADLQYTYRIARIKKKQVNVVPDSSLRRSTIIIQQ
ncbi:MAG TPA: radical SAM protein [Candidatus Mcinerneyibacteriales bacterium]|nr:radical SAM protein [Candidatus Mcinerneyibacteriales bacterium]HPJ69757.1 radical SAM protein [Candidatus Mcinerneyibacteriales bacterium]